MKFKVFSTVTSFVILIYWESANSEIILSRRKGYDREYKPLILHSIFPKYAITSIVNYSDKCGLEIERQMNPEMKTMNYQISQFIIQVNLWKAMDRNSGEQRFIDFLNKLCYTCGEQLIMNEKFNDEVFFAFLKNCKMASIEKEKGIFEVYQEMAAKFSSDSKMNELQSVAKIVNEMCQDNHKNVMYLHTHMPDTYYLDDINCRPFNADAIFKYADDCQLSRESDRMMGVNPRPARSLIRCLMFELGNTSDNCELAATLLSYHCSITDMLPLRTGCNKHKIVDVATSCKLVVTGNRATSHNEPIRVYLKERTETSIPHEWRKHMPEEPCTKMIRKVNDMCEMRQTILIQTKNHKIHVPTSSSSESVGINSDVYIESLKNPFYEGRGNENVRDSQSSKSVYSSPGERAQRDSLDYQTNGSHRQRATDPFRVDRGKHASYEASYHDPNGDNNYPRRSYGSFATSSRPNSFQTRSGGYSLTTPMEDKHQSIDSATRNYYRISKRND